VRKLTLRDEGIGTGEREGEGEREAYFIANG